MKTKNTTFSEREADVKATSRISIGEYMRATPVTIGRDRSVGEAIEKMRENDIRHLPVLHGGKLAGIVSERDLNLVRLTEGGERLKLEEVMNDVACTVPTETALADVVGEMASRKLGAALIVDRAGKVVGIFTAIDALQILKEALISGRIP